MAARQEFVRVVGAEKGLDRLDLGFGVDGPAAFGHDLNLGFAHRPVQGVDLPVDVGQTDVVKIDQCQTTDT